MSEEHLTKRERKELKKQERAAHKEAEINARRAKKKKNLMIVTISAVAIVAFMFWLLQNAPERAELFDETPAEINAVEDTDNTKGAPADSAKVTIIEYSDFECPACAAYYPLVKQVVADYEADVQFVYRHLPIRSIHTNSELSARYAEAAALQGKFFEMHDMIFDNQQSWAGTATRVARSAFESYGEALGLDVEKLTNDATSDGVIAKIEGNRIDAIGAGAQSTPSFFVNGVLLTNNPQSYDDFVEIITGERPGAVPITPELDVSSLENAMGQDHNDTNE